MIFTYLSVPDINRFFFLMQNLQFSNVNRISCCTGCVEDNPTVEGEGETESQGT